MAEIFGVVASGIGIAGVAAQAIDGIRKLQAFCNDIRDAPEEIKYLTTELEILLGTIASIEAQIQRNVSMCGNMDPTPALRFVDHSVRSLNAVIEKLNAEISQKRTMGSMKMAWKKKVLEAHLVKIERSKTSLGLAVSAYSTELYLQTATRTDTKIDQLSMYVTTLAISSQTLEPKSGPRTNMTQQDSSSHQLRVYDDDNGKSIRKKSRSSKATPILSFSLILPSWLARHSLQVNLSRSAQSWTLSLRPYRTISYDAEIWKVIARGDFDRMQSLVESGQTTIFDRDDDGSTLLHELHSSASSIGRERFLRIAHYLINHGADINEPMPDTGWLPIHMFCCVCINNQLGRSTDLRDEDLFRVSGDEHLDEDLFWQPFGGVSAEACSATFEIELRRRFPLVTLEFPSITIADRLREIRCLSSSFSPQVLVGYLGLESLEIAYSVSNDDSKRELLRGVLHHWGGCAGERNPASEQWENTIRGLFALGARFELLVDHVQEEKESPKVVKGGIVRDEVLVEVIQHFALRYVWARTWAAWLKGEECKSVYDFRCFVEGFYHFVSKTEHLGIRLEAKPSCRRFEIRVNNQYMEWTDLPFSDAYELEAHTISLYHDDGLSTWVMWDSTYEEYCGEFWDLIDHPERAMPGTWID